MDEACAPAWSLVCAQPEEGMQLALHCCTSILKFLLWLHLMQVEESCEYILELLQVSERPMRCSTRDVVGSNAVLA